MAYFNPLTGKIEGVGAPPLGALSVADDALTAANKALAERNKISSISLSGPTAGFAANSPNFTRLSFSETTIMSGDKFANNTPATSNGVIIGSGISKVQVFANATPTLSITSSRRDFSIRRNRGGVLTRVAESSSLSGQTLVLFGITDVEENDVIELHYRFVKADTIYGYRLMVIFLE